MYAVKNRWIVLVVLLCSILCLWGCRGSQAEAPIAGKTGVNGSGNGVNGGLICGDGGSGLYVSHPEDGRLLHIADGAVTRVGDVENVSQLNYSAGRLYFCADRGINDDNEPREAGVYVYDGSVRRILDRDVLTLTVSGEKLIFTDMTGAYSAAPDGSDPTLIREGFIRQIVPYEDKYYVFEIVDGDGVLELCGAGGEVLETIAPNCAGGVNVTKTQVLFFGAEGILAVPHGQYGQVRQVVYADGVRGLNAADADIFYVSSALGEPSLNTYRNQQSSVLIPPSVLGGLENGPYIVNGQIYYMARGALYRAELDGTGLTPVALE